MPVDKESVEAVVAPIKEDKTKALASSYGATICVTCGKPPTMCGCKTFATRASEAGSCAHPGTQFVKAQRSHSGNLVVNFRCTMCPWSSEVIVPEVDY